jgi:hypothetical protein
VKGVSQLVKDRHLLWVLEATDRDARQTTASVQMICPDAFQRQASQKATITMFGTQLVS